MVPTDMDMDMVTLEVMVMVVSPMEFLGVSSISEVSDITVVTIKDTTVMVITEVLDITSEYRDIFLHFHTLDIMVDIMDTTTKRLRVLKIYG